MRRMQGLKSKGMGMVVQDAGVSRSCPSEVKTDFCIVLAFLTLKQMMRITQNKELLVPTNLHYLHSKAKVFFCGCVCLPFSLSMSFPPKLLGIQV